MKQTAEEAARTHWSESTYNKDAELAYDERDSIAIKALAKAIALRAFKKGAEWQSRQSPWISVEERLPEPDKEVLLYDKNSIRHYVIGWLRRDKGYNKGMWALSNGWVEDKDITHWMPIPSFDEIFEVNKGRLITKTENMTFSEAVEAMKQGYTVFRDVYVWREYRPRGVRMNRNGKVVSRANRVSYFSYEDITATDWEIYREHENSHE